MFAQMFTYIRDSYVVAIVKKRKKIKRFFSFKLNWMLLINFFYLKKCYNLLNNVINSQTYELYIFVWLLGFVLACVRGMGT